jgi:hypothetical protein
MLSSSSLSLFFVLLLPIDRATIVVRVDVGSMRRLFDVFPPLSGEILTILSSSSSSSRLCGFVEITEITRFFDDVVDVAVLRTDGDASLIDDGTAAAVCDFGRFIDDDDDDGGDRNIADCDESAFAARLRFRCVYVC